MTSPDLDRIRFVTRHFNDLKGLALTGLGLFYMSAGVGHFARGSIATALSVFAVRLALLAGGFGLIIFTKAYYEKRFGEVQSSLGEPIPEALTIYSSGGAQPARYPPINARTSRGTLPIAGAGLVAYVALRMISPTVYVHRPFQLFAIAVQLSALVFASFFLSSWISRGYRLSQAYYLVLGLVMLGIPALGASMGFVLTALRDHPGLSSMVDRLLPAVYSIVYDTESGYLVCGACLLVAGLLDHRQLVRVLGRPAAAEPV